jgi:hypothetical protein
MKENVECACRTQALVIPRKQVSLITACLLLIGLFTFVGGYFFGYSKASNQLCINAEQELFSDAVDHSLIKQFGGTAAENLQDDQELCQETVSDGQAEAPVAGPVPLMLSQNSESVSVKKSEETVVANQKTAENSKKYQALLFGGTQQQVHNFVEKMKKRGLPVEEKRRVSISKKGVRRAWYQAVTEPFGTKNQVQAVVDTIKQYERLKDINIIEVG